MASLPPPRIGARDGVTGAMTRNRLTQLVFLLIAIVLMGATTVLRPRIDDDRDRLQLAGPARDGDDALPPAVALGTAALGSFRGLIVDVLWYRAYRLKEDGKFYEANQLSHLITQLQPRFPQVWVFHAWNMAYNISVATHTADERWYWVNSGIRLLRNQGVRLNPGSPRIYKELALILSHKVGGTADDMHWYYKRKIAEQWQELLGAPTEGSTTEEAIDAMRVIAAAPEDLGELFDKQPYVKPLWEYLSSLGYEPDEKLLRQIGAILMYNYSPDQDLWGQLGISVPARLDQRLDAIFKDTTYGPGVDPLLAFLRRRVLTETYQMNPKLMVEAMELFGPLDWRHPAAQAVYFNHLGVKAIEARHVNSEVDFVNVYRARIHAIQDLAHRGKVSFDPRMADPPDLLPDSRFIEMYERALEEALAYLKKADKRVGVFNSFEGGHENFLLKFIVDAYMTGGVDEARQLYDKLRKLYGHKDHNKERYKLALEDLVFEEFTDVADLPYVVQSFCRNMIFRALHEGLGGNRSEWFSNGIEAARALFDHYNLGKVHNPIAPENRQSISPDFEHLLTQTYLDYMSRPNYSIMRRARVWKNTPLDLQRRTYDRLDRIFGMQFRESPFDPELALPEPDGMAEYREHFAKTKEADEAKRHQEGGGTVERQ